MYYFKLHTQVYLDRKPWSWVNDFGRTAQQKLTVVVGELKALNSTFEW